jgi:hypothetical protein
MDRREFSKGILATGLAAPALLGSTSAFANRDGEEKLSRLGRVQLQLAATVVVMTYLVVLNQRGLLGISLLNPMPQFNENRAKGVLGLLGRPTLDTLMLTATLAGLVYQLNKVLYVVPQGPDIPASKVLLTHRELSWEPSGKLAPVETTTIPAFKNLPVLGRAFRTRHQDRSSLMVLIRPTLVREPGS